MNSAAIDDILARLHSIDANDRVKAASEIGEVGTPEIAPEVLKVVYEDDASTVRQMAIQSYYEILGDLSIEDIIKVAISHFDLYVRLYAISLLSNFDEEKVSNILSELVVDYNEKIRVTAIRTLIHGNFKNASNLLLVRINQEEDELALKNIIEALALWKVKDAKKPIQNYFEKHNSKMSQELKTMSLFALSAFGDKNAYKKLQNDDLDEYTRIKFNDEIYRGKNGLLELLEKL